MIGGLLAVLGCVCCHVAAADELEVGRVQDGPRASWQKPVAPPGVTQRTGENACARAGDPHRIAWYAQPSRHRRDTFGYVGGGAAVRGEPRWPEEGTWGLDYAGLFSQNHVWLGWLHGRPTRQAGGSYNTDGPHFLSH